MRHRLLTAFASGATFVFAPVAAPGATQGPGADSSTTLVAAAAWVPTRNVAVAPLRRTISLDLKEASIKQVLREIGRRGGIEIAYGDDVLHARTHVSLEAEQITVQDAVVTALAGTGLEAFVSLSGTTILVLLQLREVPHVSGWIQNLHSAVIVRLENFGCSFFDPLRAMVARRVPQ